ncbi:MAG: shikimate dehydrogenase [Opitutales bacterium]|nr:shikimate dehydrogenase [Opitutales bacterium]MCH8539544.1 shikimate dehydrogenase [Opitutales bacterium]
MPNPNPAQVYQVSDLAKMNFGPSPLAVLGYPVKHSVSPPMHNAALEEMSREKPEYRDWSYYKFEVPPEKLIESLPLFAAKGFRGLNCTIPHKTVVLPALSEVSDGALRKGAVNTLKLKGEIYVGDNTDGFGLQKAVAEMLGFSLVECPVILLGAGGAARAAAAQCLEQGASGLWIGNRNQERLQALVASLGEWAPQSEIHTFSLENIPYRDLPGGALVVNSTSVGMQPEDPLPIDPRKLSACRGIYDMIYSPPKTLLMKSALEVGIPAANGVAMLVWQGVRALEIWTGESVLVGPMRAACEKALMEKC